MVSVSQYPGIETTVERIKQQLDKIQAAKSQVQEQLNVVVSVQNQVSQQDQQISDILLRVRQARERERGHLFEMDGRPLWEATIHNPSEKRLDLLSKSLFGPLKAPGRLWVAHSWPRSL